MAVAVQSSMEPQFADCRSEPAGDDDKARHEAFRKWFSSLRSDQKHGLRYPEELFPRAVRLLRGNRLYDFNSFIVGGATVSDSFKTIVEAIEPDVHQFEPVEILRKDGTPFEGQYWYFVIATAIDAINPVREGVYKRGGYDFANHPERYSWVIKAGGQDKLAFYKDKIAGRAAWHDSRMSVHDFWSDALHDRAIAEGMEGWAVAHRWAEI